MVKKLFGLIKEKSSFFTLFMGFSLILFIILIILYFEFQKTTLTIKNRLLESDLEFIKEISSNIQKDYLSNKKDLENYFSLHKDKQKELEKALSLISGKRLKYIYILLPKKNHFIFLADGSREDKASFKEPFKPMYPSKYKDKPEYFFHKKIKTLWLTYIYPIKSESKVVAYVVSDFSLKDYHLIQQTLNVFERSYKNLVFFILIIIIVLITFAFFDKKREEKEKEAYRKIERLNLQLEEKVKKAVEESRKKDIMLYEQSKLTQMGEMVNMIAHQWRQPLNTLSVLGMTMEMKSEMGLLDDNFVKEKSKLIQNIAQDMSKTIEDFLNFSKKNKRVEKIFLYDAIEDTIKMISSQLKNHNIELKKDVQIDRNMQLYMIKSDLQHILINLLSNAKDALDSTDKKDKKIKIKVYIKNKKCYIEVKDNGPGISKERCNRVFEPYYTTKIQGKGTGLGLYLSKKIAIEHLNGDLRCIYIENGALFELFFPIKDEKRAKDD